MNINYMQKILHFIKYNNATVIILAIILLLGGGALAAGPENIGERRTSIEGVDNAALLAVDLTAFNMDFKIENVQQDEKYYYVTYSFLDLVLADNLWQYQLSQKTQKVSKKIKEDIGVYMAKFMAKHHQARVRELTEEKNQAESAGEQKRIEVTEYSGLIGRTLDLAAAVFPGYEPVVKTELPTPEFNLPTPLLKGGAGGLNAGLKAVKDQLIKILSNHGLEEMKSAGEKFNPEFHEAVETVEAENKDEGAVVEEVQKGYLLNGKVIRTAKVKVTK